jgi:hypothetical protein
VEKLNTYIPKIRLPLEPAHLYSIYKVLDLSSIQNTVFWALLLIGFYGMLRKSQFANNSRNTFNPKEQLTRGDFQFTHEGLIINIQWSKTRPKHNKIHQIPLKRIEDCVLCPVLAYSRMLNWFLLYHKNQLLACYLQRKIFVPFQNQILIKWSRMF